MKRKKAAPKAKAQLENAAARVEKSTLSINNAMDIYCKGWSEEDRRKVLGRIEASRIGDKTEKANSATSLKERPGHTGHQRAHFQ